MAPEDGVVPGQIPPLGEHDQRVRPVQLVRRGVQHQGDAVLPPQAAGKGLSAAVHPQQHIPVAQRQRLGAAGGGGAHGGVSGGLPLYRPIHPPGRLPGGHPAPAAGPGGPKASDHPLSFFTSQPPSRLSRGRPPVAYRALAAPMTKRGLEKLGLEPTQAVVAVTGERCAREVSECAKALALGYRYVLLGVNSLGPSPYRIYPNIINRLPHHTMAREAILYMIQEGQHHPLRPHELPGGEGGGCGEPGTGDRRYRLHGHLQRPPPPLRGLCHLLGQLLLLLLDLLLDAGLLLFLLPEQQLGCLLVGLELLHHLVSSLALFVQLRLLALQLRPS